MADGYSVFHHGYRLAQAAASYRTSREHNAYGEGYEDGAAAAFGVVGMFVAIRKTWADKLRTCDWCGHASHAMVYRKAQCWTCNDIEMNRRTDSDQGPRG